MPAKSKPAPGRAPEPEPVTEPELTEDALIVLALLAGASSPIQPADYLLGRPRGDGRTRAHKLWTQRTLDLGLNAELVLADACLIDLEEMDGHPNPNGYQAALVITDAGRAALVRHVTGLTAGQLSSTAVSVYPGDDRTA